MNIEDTVQVRVPRWTTERVSALGLLTDRVKELRLFALSDGQHEYDFFMVSEDHRGCLERAFTWKGHLSLADVQLFEADRRMFWEHHMDRVTEADIASISRIYSPGWSL